MSLLIDIIAKCFSMKQRVPDINDTIVIQDMEILYPAATILLDLTANEDHIEEICASMQRHNLFKYIISDKLDQLMHSDLRSTQMKKLRDLFIGMVLNLTCNIEDLSTIIELITSHNALQVLILILQDNRQDWPTHGASQALMQYSHICMNNDQILRAFEMMKVKECLTRMINQSILIHPEASVHIQDAISYLDICETKISHIRTIIQTSMHFATAA